MIADEKWIGKQERVFLAGIDILKLLLPALYTVKFNDHAAEKSGDSNPADIIREREIFSPMTCAFMWIMLWWAIEKVL